MARLFNDSAVCDPKMYGSELTTTLIRFKKSLVQFMDELIDLFPQESDLVVMRVFLDTQIEVKELMEQFVKFVVPHKNLIQTRNDSFFLENDDIFGTVDMGKVLHCKTIWSTGQLDKEDKQAMWKWFDLFLQLAEKYTQQRKKLT